VAWKPQEIHPGISILSLPYSRVSLIIQFIHSLQAGS
jgi:hypothetical protein